jgi:hypothetical protein
MKTSSAKAKGRRLQQEIRDVLRLMGKPYGLVDGDIESRGMGQAGVDVMLSPAARNLWDLAIECKNCEKLNVHNVFTKHEEKYRDHLFPLLVHSKNRSHTLVTMRLDNFIELLGAWTERNRESTQQRPVEALNVAETAA